MSTTAVRSAAEFEEQLQRYLFERSEEGRAVRVGEKEISEQAAIVARYADLFSRDQLQALRAEEQSAEGDQGEWLYRLRKTCESGLVAAELAERDDELENALLAARVTFKGEELPLRSALAQLAVIPDYKERDELGELQRRKSAEFNEQRLDLIRAYEELDADLSEEPDPVARSEEEKQISLRELESVLAAASDRIEPAFLELRETWFERLLGPEREQQPSSAHMGYVRRLSPLDATYTKERATDVCLATLAALGFDLAADRNIRLDLDDRPQKSPRACVIASDPPKVVHLITRAQGGLHDYQAFMHEAGHALHYAGCDPNLPYTFRRLARDHALTEIYSYICEAITREPAWHAEHFGLSDEEARTNAHATRFLEALLFRRYTAKLQFELDFWSSFDDAGTTSEDYAERLTSATGVRYSSDGHLADMDAGFYSADYLRAWIRHAQLRAHLIDTVGEDWWRSRETGKTLRALFTEGTRPSSEEIAARLGFEPYDTAPLIAELTTA
ncbi:MAG TPA: hypothetical protein VK490_04325 [Gaiellaceae bacterium]|jgi:hypothetical protein|nr:hypothetical protein [Gaiellaceae bacterium]